MRSAICLAVMLFACAEQPGTFPALVRLDSDLVDQEPQITEAFRLWRASFPNCPHMISEIADLEPEHTKRGDMVLRDFADPAVGGRYNSELLTIEIDPESIAREGVTGTVLHELGHAHGVMVHLETGLMSKSRDPLDQEVDSLMVSSVCNAEPGCCR